LIVKIQEDIYAYDPKLLGNFTVRQVVFIGVSFALITATFIPLYWLTGDVTGPGFLASMIGVPVMFAGLIKKDGLPYEKYLLLKIKSAMYPKKDHFGCTICMRTSTLLERN
jgi:hypothetical protein